MRMAHPLGLAGCAGGVQHDGHVAALAPGHLGVEPGGEIAVQAAAALLQLAVAVQEGLGVVPHAARVFVDDVLELRQPLLDLEELVHLLLVFHHSDAHVGVVQDVDHLLGHRVLVQRHRHAPQALRRGHRPIQLRAVVADDREVLAASEAQGVQPQRQRADLVRDLGPAPGLPDAEVLLPHARLVGMHAGMIEQQPGKGVG